MEEEGNSIMAFDMGSLRTNLPPNRRGLSRYYSGKARSFACMADVRCVEDLKKPDHQDAKKRKKHTDRKELHVPLHCRRVSSSSHCAVPFVGV